MPAAATAGTGSWDGQANHGQMLEVLREYLAELAYDTELPDLLRDFADKAAGRQGHLCRTAALGGRACPGRRVQLAKALLRL